MKYSKFEQDLISFFESKGKQAFKVRDLAEIFNMHKNNLYKRLVKALNFLESRGELQVSPNGEFRRAVQLNRVEGTYRANQKGYGFVSYEEGQADLFVPKGESLDAMNGDRVEVEVIKQVDPSTGKGSLAKVVKVLERAAHQLVGEFFAYNQEQRQDSGYLGYVVPQGDYSDAMKIYILPEGIHPALNSICIVQIKEYPNADKPMELVGLVSKEIGHKDEPGVDILSILYQFDIPSEFPQAVKDEAEEIPQEISSKDLEGRTDLRDLMVITIDGASAKDIDDAISIRKISPDLFELGVHIADVAHYVQRGSAIDKEALRRGTSVYLTDRVVPMLPQRLSNGICSLLPHEDRLAVSCIMEINSQGMVVKHKLVLSVIQSKYRMTYEDVNLMIDGDSQKNQEYSDISNMVQEMVELHHILEAMRIKRGALNFDAKEAEIIVDATGHPIDIVLRERFTAERLIESFMLVANETIADDYENKKLPFLYRIHEQPDPDRMERFAEFITAFGMILRGNVEHIRPKQLQETLDKIKGQPFEPVVSTMMLRSMQQAKYSEEPLGHYGLATQDYTHFTAPIRRYPDLLVHRLIHLYLSGKVTSKELHILEEKIPGIAEHTSKMERRAVDAERETESLKKAEFMLDKVGQEFDGVITSITNFGMFVSLPNTVEGLIKLTELKGDYYNFNQQHLMLIGERTGKVFRIGQKVTIEVEHVSVEDREIDFRLIKAEPLDDVTVVTSQLQVSNSKKKVKSKGSSSKLTRNKKGKQTNFTIRKRKK